LPGDLSEHVKEMSDLALPERIRIMNTVFAAAALPREPDPAQLAARLKALLA
jgi:hypothetical protein